MNNYQWLLQMDGAERKAWFDAEHVETEERALDGDTAALNARINELRAHEREWRVLSKQLVDEREHYREKCSKMATIIHDALMVMDEGMA